MVGARGSAGAGVMVRRSLAVGSHRPVVHQVAPVPVAPAPCSMATGWSRASCPLLHRCPWCDAGRGRVPAWLGWRVTERAMPCCRTLPPRESSGSDPVGGRCCPAAGHTRGWRTDVHTAAGLCIAAPVLPDTHRQGGEDGGVIGQGEGVCGRQGMGRRRWWPLMGPADPPPGTMEQDGGLHQEGICRGGAAQSLSAPSMGRPSSPMRPSAGGLVLPLPLWLEGEPATARMPRGVMAQL